MKISYMNSLSIITFLIYITSQGKYQVPDGGDGGIDQSSQGSDILNGSFDIIRDIMTDEAMPVQDQEYKDWLDNIKDDFNEEDGIDDSKQICRFAAKNKLIVFQGQTKFRFTDDEEAQLRNTYNNAFKMLYAAIIRSRQLEKDLGTDVIYSREDLNTVFKMKSSKKELIVIAKKYQNLQPTIEMGIDGPRFLTTQVPITGNKSQKGKRSLLEKLKKNEVIDDILKAQRDKGADSVNDKREEAKSTFEQKAFSRSFGNVALQKYGFRLAKWMTHRFIKMWYGMKKIEFAYYPNSKGKLEISELYTEGGFVDKTTEGAFVDAPERSITSDGYLRINLSQAIVERQSAANIEKDKLMKSASEAIKYIKNNPYFDKYGQSGPMEHQILHEVTHAVLNSNDTFEIGQGFLKNALHENCRDRDKYMHKMSKKKQRNETDHCVLRSQQAKMKLKNMKGVAPSIQDSQYNPDIAVLLRTADNIAFYIDDLWRGYLLQA